MAPLKSLRSAIILGIPWSIATGAFMLIRYYRTGSTAVWENWEGSYLSFWLVASVVLTLVDHASESLCQSNRIRRKPYRWIIALKVSAMALAMVIMILVTYGTAVYRGVAPPGHWWDSLLTIVTDAKFYVAFAYALSTIAVFSFFRLMRGMIGARVLKNLILGRYHHPRSEQRVFMFLDMKSSTTHAERLGHELFSRLIQDCFADITESVIQHEAEIYQYVGDEIILTWHASEGARNANCLKILFAYCAALDRHGDHYRQQYGFVPAFKAGVNFGSVTVAEVGVLKRDIAYLSDILNTAARIEGECNKHDQTLMISESVRDLVGDSQGLEFQEIGALELRGKDEKVLLFGVQQACLASELG